CKRLYIQGHPRHDVLLAETPQARRIPAISDPAPQSAERICTGIALESNSVANARHALTMAYPFYTIGHGTRPIGQFAGLLQSAGVTLVADVRSVPRSRTNPQYNRDRLPQSLAAFHIGYEHVAALGGLRGRRRESPSEVNA